MPPFATRRSIEQVEEGLELAPRFGPDGLLPSITTDAASGEVLMLGWMNAEALQRTLATQQAHCWSRSRRVLWHKGGTSGLVQHEVELRIDPDTGALRFTEDRKTFAPRIVYGDAPNPTVL
jgi:phosphoribosyl-AMP cyclohydrolase